MNKSFTDKKEIVWDKKNSTFVRTIYLKNGYTFTGYSKKFGRNERRDKIDLLTNWILRDLRNGYLDRNTTRLEITELDRIEYLFQANDRTEPIINLYYDFPDWVGSRWMGNKKLHSFINRLYDMLSKGRSPEEILNSLEVRTRAPKFDPLDVSMPRFSSMRDLNACVFRLRSEGNLPEEAIDNFYRKYKEKYFKL
jgi:hypothetical protein